MNTQKLTLENGLEVMVDWDSKSRCKKCNQKIIWATTKNDKYIPVSNSDGLGWKVHFDECLFQETDYQKEKRRQDNLKRIRKGREF